MKLPRDIQTIDIENIYIGHRQRKADPERVAALAASIKDIGLMTPITLRTIPAIEINGNTEYEVPALIAGLHRIEAYKVLGIEEIPYIEVTCDDIEAQLWEIAENLHRAELTALERDEQVAKWIELSDNRVLTQPVAKPGRPESGVRSAAREIGVNREDARRAVKVASLSPEAKEAARDVGLDDNRTALLEAARAAPERQATVIRDYAEKKVADKNKLDGDLKARAAKEVASIIAEHVPGEWWDGLKANLYACGAANIANELTNITGQSIMDARYA